MSENISLQTAEKMKKAPGAASRADHLSCSKRVSLHDFDGKIKLFNLGHNPEDSVLKLEGHQRAAALMFFNPGLPPLPRKFNLLTCTFMKSLLLMVSGGPAGSLNP